MVRGVAVSLTLANHHFSLTLVVRRGAVNPFVVSAYPERFHVHNVWQQRPLSDIELKLFRRRRLIETCFVLRSRNLT